MHSNKTSDQSRAVMAFLIGKKLESPVSTGCRVEGPLTTCTSTEPAIRTNKITSVILFKATDIRHSNIRFFLECPCARQNQLKGC